ncbi:MAG: hypothetical protein CL534_11835 [Ahrensia sp.]|nr:hypothetical protein [Ahrensia sp.]
MLVGAREEAVNAHAAASLINPQVLFVPRLLTDGRYAVSPDLLRDSEYDSVLSTISGWSLEDLDPSLFVVGMSPEPSRMFLSVDDKVMWQFGRRSSLTMPSADVFKFEVKPNDFGAATDSSNGNRRSEIVAEKGWGVGLGTVWISFGLILGSAPGLAKSSHGVVHQWHSHDLGVSRSPVLSLNAARDGLKIRTASSASLYGGSGDGVRHPENGLFVVHHTRPLPPENRKVDVVMEATFGMHGHLNVWLDGCKVVDADAPIGYYEDLEDGSGRTVLGYPQWGLYTQNGSETDTVYISHPEWGSDLSSRIRAPLPIAPINA